LLSDIVGSVHVAVGDHAASVAFPQATFNATVAVFMATHTTRRGRPTLVSLFDFDPVFTRLVVNEVHQSLVRPIVQPLVTVATPVIFVYTTGITDDQRADATVSTPLNDVFRQGVQKVVFPLGEFVTRPLRLL
jgi:hypothetical protein